VISGYLIVSNLFSKSNIIVVVLFMILSLSRASVFVFLSILIYSLSGKLSFSLKKLVILLSFLVDFSIYPNALIYRESLRNGDEAKLIQILILRNWLNCIGQANWKGFSRGS
jgi:hypothetical protein